ncbi:MAG TPA: ribokinase [Tepidisphaeraceae bacterium]|nr:ribokinase [Tepidisphaeraceae bacterium]
MPTSGGDIVVIGSINMDLVCQMHTMPSLGQTVMGQKLLAIPGGKGANQAVAAARLVRGRRVHMVGRVGDDEYGRRLVSGLKRCGVETNHVKMTRGVGSGVAVIFVDARGENSIVVIPGANHHLTPADVDRAEKAIARAAVVVMQLEVPIKTVEYAIAKCRKLGVRVILDPAPMPAQGLSPKMLNVQVLTPNQTEAQQLLRSMRKGATHNPAKVATILRAAGPQNVVLKLGAAGAMIVDRDGTQMAARGFKVKAIDTTAAGDAFTGALAVAIAEGAPLPEAVRFGNAAGALCCMSLGAQPAMPKRAVVEQLCRSVD